MRKRTPAVKKKKKKAATAENQRAPKRQHLFTKNSVEYHAGDCALLKCRQLPAAARHSASAASASPPPLD